MPTPLKCSRPTAACSDAACCCRHESEQPFTRELHGVKIAPGIERVTVRARHKPKGYDGRTLRITLPK